MSSVMTSLRETAADYQDHPNEDVTALNKALVEALDIADSYYDRCVKARNIYAAALEGKYGYSRIDYAHVIQEMFEAVL